MQVSIEGLRQLQRDIDSLSQEALRLTGEKLDEVWAETRQTISIPLNDCVTEYVQPNTRQQNFKDARPAKV